MDAVGENAHLAVMHGRDVVYVVEGTGAVQAVTGDERGVRIPAHLDGERAVHARGPPAARRCGAVPGQGLVRVALESTAITTPGQPRAELSRTRERGWAVEEGDVTSELRLRGGGGARPPGAAGGGWRSRSWGHKIDDERRRSRRGHVRRTAEALTPAAWGGAGAGQAAGAGGNDRYRRSVHLPGRSTLDSGNTGDMKH
ncbi:hypothetical protein QJS66_13750 [Kocuria rhizophila]|nr:hypothetical protein QJS66_13750 [Kocuria rhizophila]